MNYTLYLQVGGELEAPQVENRLGEKEVQQLVANIINGDEESAKILVENAMKDPENAYITDAIAGAQEAAQQGNEQAAKFISIVGPLLEQARLITTHKCGGKVRAKIKKACGGKKMEKGGETPIKKEAKGGKPCPCTLHRVGGRLIEVDCNGVPVHYAQDGDNTGNWFTRLADRFASMAKQSGANYTPGAGSIAGSIIEGTPSGIVGSPAQESTVSTGAGNSKYNRHRGIFADTNLSDKSLAGRQQWVKDNADYLKSLGWTDDRIAGYKGSAQDNYALLDAINGQPTATYGNDLTNQQLLDYNPEAEGAQQLGAEAAARRQKLLEAQNARNQALTFNGKQYADEIAYNMAVGSANNAAALKYYQDRQAADNAYAQRRAQAIGYNGSNKNILARRNAAFDNIAKWQAGELDPQTLSLRERNDMAQQMRRSKDRSIYNMPQYGEVPTIIQGYSGPAALTQELLNATSFKNGGLISYKNYLSI